MLYYKILKGVIYRKYGEECYIWNVKTGETFIFDKEMFDIMQIIQTEKWCSVEIILKKLSDKYSVAREQEEELLELLNYLVGLGILTNKDEYLKKENDFDDFVINQLIKNNQLICVVFELTYHCNEKCKHCYVDESLKKEDLKPELTTEEIYMIIDQLYEANVAWITFTGGEIFCRNDAMDIIEYAVNKNFMVDIFSNGTLVDDEKILRLAKCNLRSYQSSVYGSNEIIHDSITKVTGSFYKTCNVLRQLTELGTATCMKCTIMKDNVDDYKNIVALSNSIGCKLQISSSISPTLMGDKVKTQLRIDDYKLMNVLNEEWIRTPPPKSVDEKILSKTNVCNAGYFSLTINPYGDVYICSGLGEPIGNLRIEKILDIWNNSPQLKWWKKQSLADVVCMNDCKLQKECSFCPSQAYLETGNCFEKYEEACKIAKIQMELEVKRNEENN